MERLDPKQIETILALTPLQEGMLFHYLQDPQGRAYVEQLSLEIYGDSINRKNFEKAWNTVIATNEMLRTVFRWEKLEKPSQIILKEQSYELIFHDLSDMDNNLKEAALAEIKSKDRDEGFDLARVPFRVILCKLEEKKYEMVISNHHILYDGWSNGIILKEFFNAYHELCRGGRSLKLPTKPSFKEFIKYFQSQDRKTQEQYWRNYLAGFETPTELPIKRRKEETTGPEVYLIILAEEIRSKLEIFVKNNRVTLAAVFYTVWGILLQKYSSSEDVIFGTTVSGRSARINNIEDMVGLFINTIPLRVQSAPGVKLIELVSGVENDQQVREEFENTPLVAIGSYSSMNGSGSLFDTLVAIENYPLDNSLLPNDRVLSIDSYAIVETTNYGLAVGIMAFNEIEIKFTYRQGVFAKEAIENLAGHFKVIIQEIIENPEETFAQLEIITSEEKNRILYEFNNTEAQYPTNKTIHQLFVEQAEKTPDHIALVGADSQICPKTFSYRQLNEQADRLAGFLIEKGIQADTIVGIMMERSSDLIIGILGILKSGAAYLPINPKNPGARTEYMLKDSATKLLITSGHKEGEKVGNWEGEKMPLEFSAGHSNHFSFHRSSHLAYLIYTSGSTGNPKGVPVTHGNFCPLLHWGYKQLGIGLKDRTLQNLSYYFDWSVWEIFITLTTGAELVMVPDELALNPGDSIPFMKKNDITVLHATPSQYQHLNSGDDKLETLKYLFLGAEQLTVDLLKRSFTSVPGDCRVFNMYGPTEATIISAVLEIKRGTESRFEDLGSVPIGGPVANGPLLVLDKYLNMCPVNVTGELYIGGDGVAMGYLNNPELTAEKFNHDEKNKRLVGLIYKTGDLARWLSDGNIEFIGRIDHQVKIRGFRIELGEIENLLRKHNRIKETVVVLKEDETGDKTMAAYFVSDMDLVNAELRAYLLKDLPDYMIPSYFVRLEKLPLNTNGKIDRGALPVPEVKEISANIAPRNEIEIKLAEIWAGILGRNTALSQIGIDDNFFQLGGHSLKATSLAARIYKEFNVKIPLGEIFKRPTIRGLSDYINGAAGEHYVRTAPVEKKEYYVLSSAQKRLYFLQQMELENTVYNMSSVMTLTGRLDKEKFAEIFNKLIARHESLRTSFEFTGDQPVQRIHDHLALAIDYYHLTTDVTDDKNDKVHISSFITAHLNRAFDLSQAPLLRVGLVKLPKSKSLLLVEMHHIISDGTSLGILAKEFMALYEGQELPLLKIHYKDYAEWQTSEKNLASLNTQEKFWLGQFAEEIPVLNLPTDFSRPKVQGFEGNHALFELTMEEASTLKTLALEQEVTLYMLLLAVCNTWFSKLGGEEDIVIGTPVAGRRHDEHQDIVGMFVNTLALRNYPAATRVFDDFLQEIKERTIAAFQNQDYPFELLVDRVVKNRDSSRNPLFDVMFVFQNMDMPGIEIPGLILQPYEFENKTSKFDLNLDGMEKDGQLFFSLEYSTRLFKAETARRFCAYFKNIINSILVNPGVRIADIEIMGPDEKKKILEIANGMGEYVDPQETVHGMFANVVPGNEDKTALVFGEGRITYGELNRAAGRLAKVLRSHGVGRDNTVGLMVERSFELVTGMLAIMKAGGAYLPIDPKYPEQRKRFMIEDSHMTTLLTNFDIDRAATYIPGSIRILDLRNDDIYRDISDSTEDPLSNINIGSDLVYVIFTSGSTGKPKGVMLEHTNLVNLVKFHHQYTHIDCTKVLQFATISFDASWHEIFSALLAGGELYLIDEETRNNIPALFAVIAKNKIKTLFLPMAFLKLIFSHEEYINIFPGAVAHIQTAGEQVVVDERFGNYLKKAHVYLHNHYGPSETHVVTVLTLDPRQDIPEFPSIGKPVMNTSIYILDKNNRLLPVGVTGELWIGGIQVGRGYLGKVELTAETFMPNPFAKGERLYRTGDMSRWLPNGNIEFLGRRDYQVKIRGFRIEPGEIENRLLKHKDIKNAVVLTMKDKTAALYLAAYYVSDKKFAVTELREYLLTVLPDYMIPARFIQIAKIPLTLNNKLDRKSLPNPEIIEAGKEYTPPESEIEKKLVEIWEAVLDKAPISINDHFFDLGGHSLKAMVVVNRVHKVFAVALTIQDLFQWPTVKGLADLIQKSSITGFTEITKVPEQPYYELSYSQKRLWVIVKQQPRSSLFNMPVKVTLHEAVDASIIAKILDRWLLRHEILRASFQDIAKEPVMVIEPVSRIKMNFNVLDLSGLAGTELENKRKQLWAEESTYVFNLEAAPLFKASLVKCGPEEYDFILNMHHIIFDGWSMEILQKEFFSMYDAYKKGWGYEPGPLAIRYIDFAAWQNRLLRDKQRVKQAKEFWKSYLKNDLPVLNLPYDFSQHPTRQSAGFRSVIPGELANGLKKIAETQGATLFITLLAAFNCLLSRVCGQEDIIMAMPTASRQHEALKNVVGMFVNTVILRTAVKETETFTDFFQRFRDDIFRVLEYQSFPMESICGELKIKYPDVHVFFNMTNTIDTSGQTLPETASSHNETVQEAKFDLVYYLAEYRDGIEINCHYFKDRFKPDTIERLTQLFIKMLTTIAGDPGCKIAEISLAGKRKRQGLKFIR